MTLNSFRHRPLVERLRQLWNRTRLRDDLAEKKIFSVALDKPSQSIAPPVGALRQQLYEQGSGKKY